MIRVSQKGFTLVEVILFMAVSGLFFMIAFMGVRSRSNAIQFTDSMRSLQSFIQAQQNEVYNGVNPRPNGIDCTYNNDNVVSLEQGISKPGQSEECLLVGKAIHFNADSSEVEVYPIVGRFLRNTGADPTSKFAIPRDGANNILPDTEIITTNQGLNAWIILSDDHKTTYTAKWGVVYKSKASNPFWLGFIRSPLSGTIYPFSIDLDNLYAEQVPLYFVVDPSLYPEYNGINYKVTKPGEASGSYCFAGINGQDAQINIGGGSGDVAEIKFDTGCAQ